MFYFCSMADAAAHSDLDAAVARIRRLMALLSELTDTGMELARGLKRELMAGGSAVEIEVRFCRIARAIRRLVALEARLARALDDVASGRWAGDEASRELDALAAQAHEDEAVEALETAVREAGDGEAFENLRERLDDWHAERSVERDFAEKPVAEIVREACKAMGVAPDHELISDEAMGQTLADAVRAYAAAFQRAGHAPPRREARPADWSPPPQRRPDTFADPRPPPG
jgi:hypothetical protein